MSLVKCSLGSCEFSITLNSLIRVTCIQNTGARSETLASFRYTTLISAFVCLVSVYFEKKMKK